jgi:hypothetical protein
MINNNGTGTDIVGFSDVASSSLFGVVKVDNTTITSSGGVISAVGGGGAFCSGSVCTVPSAGSGVNGYITYGANFGNSMGALVLYDGGSGQRFGWGLAAGDMQLYVSSSSIFTWRQGGDFNSTRVMELDGSANLLVNGAVEPNNLQVVAHVFSALPSCVSGVEGSVYSVTDSTTNTWGATITGLGSDHVMAYCDGSAWTVAAK